MTFVVMEAAAVSVTTVVDGADCGVSEIEVGWDAHVSEARQAGVSVAGYAAPAPPTPPPTPTAPIGHENGLVAYWTFDSTTDPLLDVVGGRRLARVDPSGNTCLPSDPRAHYALVADATGTNLAPSASAVGSPAGANVLACETACDADLTCFAFLFQSGTCTLYDGTYDLHDLASAGSGAFYYRDCSNYGAGWARMGGHGHQMRLDGDAYYTETSLSGATARAELHPSNTAGFTVCAIASSADTYEQCSGSSNADDADCVPLLVSNGMHPASARANDGTSDSDVRRGWSLGMNRAMCRCDRGDQHMAAYGPHGTHVRLGGSDAVETALTDEALMDYMSSSNGLYEGVFTGRMSGGFTIENGLLGDVDDVTWGAIDACQRDRSIDWARDDYCLEEAWPSDHASSDPQAETWLPKLVCSVLDAPKQVGLKDEREEGCWVRGEDSNSTTWPGAVTSIDGVTPIAVANIKNARDQALFRPHDVSKMTTWSDCAHACLDMYLPYGTIDPQQAVYFNWQEAVSCECLAEPVYSGVHGDTAATQPTIAVSDSTRTTGRACAYRSGRLYFNGIEVAREAIDYHKLTSTGYEAVEPSSDTSLFSLTLGAAARSRPAGAPNWIGSIDELAIWQRALTPEEMTSMHRRVMDEGKVIANWASTSPPSPAPAPPLLDTRYSCCDGGNANPGHVNHWRQYAGQWIAEHPTGDWQTPTDSLKYMTTGRLRRAVLRARPVRPPRRLASAAARPPTGIACTTVVACAAEGCLPVDDASYARPPPPTPVMTPPSPSDVAQRRAPAPPAAHAFETGILLDGDGTFTLASGYGERAACASAEPVFQHLSEVTVTASQNCNRGGIQAVFAAASIPTGTADMTIDIDYYYPPLTDQTQTEEAVLWAWGAESDHVRLVISANPSGSCAVGTGRSSFGIYFTEGSTKVLETCLTTATYTLDGWHTARITYTGTTFSIIVDGVVRTANERLHDRAHEHADQLLPGRVRRRGHDRDARVGAERAAARRQAAQLPCLGDRDARRVVRRLLSRAARAVGAAEPPGWSRRARASGTGRATSASARRPRAGARPTCWSTAISPSTRAARPTCRPTSPPPSRRRRPGGRAVGAGRRTPPARRASTTRATCSSR